METKSRAEYHKAWRAKRKNDQSYKDMVKSHVLKRKEKLALNPELKQEEVKYHRQYAKVRSENINPLDNFKVRLNQMKKLAKECNVNCLITEDELRHILHNEKCYLTGIKISEDLINHKFAYYLDRIGKKEFGGDGKKGGDYVLGNVRPCIFKVNRIRDTLDITSTQAKILFYPARIYVGLNNIVNKIKKYVKKGTF